MLAVIVVVVDEQNRFLLIQESKRKCRAKWFLPGGRVEKSESLITAAIREVKEETGINIVPTGLLYIDQGSKNGRDRIRFVFIGKKISGKLKTNEDEHSILATWKTYEEIEKLDLRSPFVLKVIDIYRNTTKILNIRNIHFITSDELLVEKP